MLFGREIRFEGKNRLGGSGAFCLIGRDAERVHSKGRQFLPDFFNVIVNLFKLLFVELRRRPQRDAKVFEQPGFFAAARDLAEHVIAGNRAFFAGDMVVVDESGNLTQFGIESGTIQRRWEMSDDGRHGTALGLQAFTDVVHDIGIKLRHCADNDFARVGGGVTDFLARQPFVRGVRADMDHRVSLKALLQPKIKRQVLVMRRQRDIVIDGLNVLIPAARGLWREQQIAPSLRRKHEERLPGVIAPDHGLALLRLAPFGDNLGAQARGQLIKPHAVLGNCKQLHATGTREFVQLDGDICSRHGIISERADGGEQFIGVRRCAVRRETVGAKAVENLQQ